MHEPGGLHTAETNECCLGEEPNPKLNMYIFLQKDRPEKGEF